MKKLMVNAMNELYLKKEKLDNILRECGSVTVAFSSGADSTYLLREAAEVLGSDNVCAVTVASVFMPGDELTEAESFCREHGIRHEIINADVLSIPGVADNPPNRCYLCKKAVFTLICEFVNDDVMAKPCTEHTNDADGSEHKPRNVIICEGSNADDVSDYRPGMQAVKELSVRSPLLEAGLTKADIRELSRELMLNTCDKPSAACLASRCAYNEHITEEKLSLVEDAERYIGSYGFTGCRVRIHGNASYIARIELADNQVDKFMKVREDIYNYLKLTGFSYVTLDLGGYRTGSMNEVINTKRAE